MAEPVTIDADAILREVMDDHPATVAVFLRRRMHCPGCAMSGFMTLGEAATTYALDAEALVAELRAAAGTAGEVRP